MCALNIFYAIIAILEGGMIHGDNETANEIIGLCKEEAGRQLAIYDRACAAALRAGR